MDRTSAVNSANPCGDGGVKVWPISAPALPRQVRHAMINRTNAAVLAIAVTICVRLPDLMPIHCNNAKMTMTADAMDISSSFRQPKRTALYSPMTITASEMLLQVDNQSLQPITKPAYGPSARRTNTVNPPDSGIIVPNSANVFAPRDA